MAPGDSGEPILARLTGDRPWGGDQRDRLANAVGCSRNYEAQLE
jgi:hypothetical protein